MSIQIGHPVHLTPASVITSDPGSQRAANLKSWWTSRCAKTPPASFAPTSAPPTLLSVHADQLPNPNLSFYATVTVVQLKKDGALYPTCLTARCSRKAQETSDGSWFCTTCAKSNPTHGWGVVLKLLVEDATHQMWCTALGDVCYIRPTSTSREQYSHLTALSRRPKAFLATRPLPSLPSAVLTRPLTTWFSSP